MTTARRVTTTEAAQMLDVPPDRIRAWTSRHQVTPVGRTPKQGRHPAENIYEVAELEPLAAAYHRRRHADTTT